MKNIKSETKYLKVTVTGTVQSIKDQFKLITEFADTKVEEMSVSYPEGDARNNTSIPR